MNKTTIGQYRQIADVSSALRTAVLQEEFSHKASSCAKVYMQPLLPLPKRKPAIVAGYVGRKEVKMRLLISLILLIVLLMYSSPAY